MKTKAEKAQIIEQLQTAFKTAASTVFVHFRGITVGEETVMRKSLRDEGVKYSVARKTLIQRALTGAGLSEAQLDGEIAVVTGGADASVAARSIHAFGKTFGAERFSIVGGIFEGLLKTGPEMQEIATIPALPVLRGMFAQVINSPRQRFAVVLSEVAKTKN
ncbi:50S ribosomal protein L10 [bacterium]|nr:50S ribosomal protein L10 [bacterium]